MKLGTLFSITAVVAVIFGLGFLLVPAQVLAYYGTELSEMGLVMTRYFGAALLGYAVLAWLMRDARRSEAHQPVVTSFLVSTVLGLIVALLALFTTEVNQLGWLNVIVYLLLALGFAYFQFTAPERAATPSTPSMSEPDPDE